MSRADILGLVLLACTALVWAVLWLGERRLRRVQREWDEHTRQALYIAADREP